MTESILEYASSAGLTLTVDRQNGVIPGVKVLGTKSRNGRTYTQECVSKAAPLYENAAVFVDHKADGARSYHERMGHICNPVVREDGIYADFRVNPKHALAEQLFWDAENAPGNVGFSHDVEGRTDRKNGTVIVEEIVKVNSVDLVARPATTNGLFESEVPEDQRELCEHGLSAVSDARTILLGSDPLETKVSRLREVLAEWRAELGIENKENKTMDYKDVTIEGLREHRKDLVESLTGQDQVSKLNAKVQELQGTIAEKEKEVIAAQAKIAEHDAEKAKVEKAAAIQEELKVAKLDVSNKTLVSEAFMAILEAAPDAATRKSLIEDRVAITKVRGDDIGTPPFSALDSGDGPKTTKELLARL